MQTIKFIYKGKIMMFDCVEREAHDNKFNTYYCTGVRDVACLTTNDGRMIVLVNPNYEKENGQVLVEMRYIYFMLQDYFGEDRIEIIDTCMASYFGFMKTISFIKEMETNQELVLGRVEMLEKLMTSGKQLQIISKGNLIQSFKAVELGGQKYEEVG